MVTTAYGLKIILPLSRAVPEKVLAVALHLVDVFARGPLDLVGFRVVVRLAARKHPAAYPARRLHALAGKQPAKDAHTRLPGQYSPLHSRQRSRSCAGR